MARGEFESLDFNEPSEIKTDELATHILLGLDTNILKILRRSPTTTQELSERAEQADVSLILPAQAVTEYWNNYKVFTKEDLQKNKSQAEQLQKNATLPEVAALAGDMIEILDKALVESTSAEDLYRRTSETLATLMSVGQLFSVDRPMFFETGRARLGSKTPPGFADEKEKTYALGDFYVWADFLLGAAVTMSDLKPGAVRLVFATEDSKPDWRSGGQIHPILAAESKSLVGTPAELWNFEALRVWLESSDA